MRLWIPLALAVLLTAPALVVAESDEPVEAVASAEAAASVSQEEEERRERYRTCQTLTKQIAHYEEVAARAEERENELWEQATEQQIERLEARRFARCPEYRDDGGLQAFLNFLVTAGRVAATLFTMGWI